MCLVILGMSGRPVIEVSKLSRYLGSLARSERDRVVSNKG